MNLNDLLTEYNDDRELIQLLQDKQAQRRKMILDHIEKNQTKAIQCKDFIATAPERTRVGISTKLFKAAVMEGKISHQVADEVRSSTTYKTLQVTAK